MKIDNNVPHFICEGASVTRLGDALRERQKKIDGCCAQCKDLSKKKGEKE